MSPAGLLSVQLVTGALVGVVLEGSLLLGATWALTALLRRRSAAVRHTVWTTGFALVLLVPAARAVLPDAARGWLRAYGTGPGLAPSTDVGALPPADPFPGLPPEYADGAATRGRPGVGLPAPGSSGVTAGGPVGVPGDGPAWRSGTLLARSFFLVWGLGTLALLIRLAGHRVRVGRLTRRGTPLAPAARPARLVAREARRMGIRRRVRVLYTPELPVPVTWGTVRPVLLLPPDAASWDDARLRAVTVHELAHVRRWDALGQQLAEVARALYWANPLVWVARRLAAREREAACDDEVLRGGMAAPLYAGVLMDMARRAGAAPPGIGQEVEGGLAMAGRSRLEARVAAVLEGPGSDPRAGRRAGAASCLGLTAVASALVATSPGFDHAPSPRGDASAAARVAAVRVLGAECDEVSLWTLTRAVQADPAAAVRKAAARALGTHDDPRSVDVLAHAAADGRQHRGVRRVAMTALGGRDSPRAAEALLARLRENDPALRRASLRAMGRMDRQEGRVRGPVAVVLLKDTDPTVRAAAARALRGVGDDASLPWLREALKDPSAAVVREARSTLEHLGAT